MTDQRPKIFYVEMPARIDTRLSEEDALIIARQLGRVTKWWGAARTRLYDEQNARNLSYVLTNASFDYCRYPRGQQLP